MRALLILFLFVGVPLAEVAVFAWAGGALGVWPTVGLTLATAALGLALLRRQGLSTLMRARERAARDEPPVRELVEGVFLALGGLFLFVPGFVTDVFGFALLTPPLRGWLADRLARTATVHAGPGRRPPGGGGVIDGDYHVVPDDRIGAEDVDRRPPSG